MSANGPRTTWCWGREPRPASMRAICWRSRAPCRRGRRARRRVSPWRAARSWKGVCWRFWTGARRAGSRGGRRRNMFGPVRGPWQGSEWRGWWGEHPPFHHAVFVLTHFERPAFTVDDTTFYFVTGDIDEALAKARGAAGEHEVRLGGGVATIREFLDARLLDELHLAV